MKFAFFVGIAGGVFLVALAGALLSLRAKKHPAACAARRFDERQLAVQNRAFKCAYFTLLIYILVYIVASAGGLVWAREYVGIPLGIFLSVLVFANISIFADAYFAPFENQRSLLMLFLLCGAANCAIGISHIITGDFMEDGLVSTPALNLGVGVMLFDLAAAILIKRSMSRRASEME